MLYYCNVAVAEYSLLGLKLDLASCWSVVMHTYFYHFSLSLWLSRRKEFGSTSLSLTANTEIRTVSSYKLRFLELLEKSHKFKAFLVISTACYFRSPACCPHAWGTSIPNIPYIVLLWLIAVYIWTAISLVTVVFKVYFVRTKSTSITQDECTKPQFIGLLTAILYIIKSYNVRKKQILRN